MEVLKVLLKPFLIITMIGVYLKSLITLEIQKLQIYTMKEVNGTKIYGIPNLNSFVTNTKAEKSNVLKEYNF